MGIILVYDVTNESSFTNIRAWMQNIHTHASASVSKILVASKSDLDANRCVTTEQGKALAAEFGIPFFETSSKTGHNVEAVFEAITAQVLARDVFQPTPTGLWSGPCHVGTPKPKQSCCK
eukprot:c20590_g1_i1.p1 GENE.c20590_g1_i1~~c20590_g1_i1.p1  ORF type:complete len:130 (-),score=31.54 c20590_g1_i1:76-435(-)